MENIVWQPSSITRLDREHLQGHSARLIWLTGLSGSGKTTIANALEKELFAVKCRTFVLDGDNVRHGLNSNLGFSEEDRHENIRRVGEVAKLMVEAGIFTIAAFISPYSKDRDFVRSLFNTGDFLEVYCKASLDTCWARDPKGLYDKAHKGFIKNYTGVDAPYEPPTHAEIVVNTEHLSVEESVNHILGSLTHI